MCIAILKPAKKRLHKDVLLECFQQNRDGAGFAFHDPDKKTVNYSKGYFDFESFWKDYEPYQDHKCLIHFRVATHKNVDGDNCHPWRVNRKLVFIHNGRIAGMDQDDSLSDTGNFCVMLGELLESAPDYYKTPEFKWFATNAIGSGNKLVFLDADGEHLIINEKAGNWKDDVWFSNMSYGCARSRGVGVLEDCCYPAKTEPPQVKAIANVNTPPASVNINADDANAGESVHSSSIAPSELLKSIHTHGHVFVSVTNESEIDKVLADLNREQFSPKALAGASK